MRDHTTPYKTIVDNVRLHKIIQDYRTPYKPYKTVQDIVDHIRLSYKTIGDHKRHSNPYKSL